MSRHSTKPCQDSADKDGLEGMRYLIYARVYTLDPAPENGNTSLKRMVILTVGKGRFGLTLCKTRVPIISFSLHVSHGWVIQELANDDDQLPSRVRQSRTPGQDNPSHLLYIEDVPRYYPAMPTSYGPKSVAMYLSMQDTV